LHLNRQGILVVPIVALSFHFPLSSFAVGVWWSHALIDFWILSYFFESITYVRYVTEKRMHSSMLSSYVIFSTGYFN
jgi:hypothetical protein